MDIYKLLRIITGRPPTGAVYFSEKEIRYSILNSVTLADRKEYVVQLPPGIIEDGEIKNRESLKQALLYLTAQANLSKNFKTVVVGVQLPDIFSVNIELPLAPTKEAIELNAAPLSPIPLDRAYLSWQELGANPKTGQNQVMVVISPRKTIDDYNEVLQKSGFLPLVIEPAVFSSVRFLKFLGGLELFKNYLLIIANPFSLEFAVLDKLEIKSIFFLKESLNQKSAEEINGFVSQTIQRFLNYYEDETGSLIDDFIILADLYTDVIADSIARNFNKTPIIFGHQEMSLGELFSLGAALRGLAISQTNKELNLLPLKPRTEYYLILVKDFIEVWGLISLISVLTIAGALFFTRFYLKSLENDVQGAAAVISKNLPQDKYSLLNSQIANVNLQLQNLKTIKDQLVDWPALFNQIMNLPTNVTILNLTASRSGDGSIQALAPSRDAAIAFKDALSKIPQVKNVDLPLSQIQDLGGGKLSFLLNFNFRF